MLRVYADHHPHDRFGPANVVTSLRAMLVVALLTLLWQPATAGLHWIAGWTAAVAIALDGVDGWLARRTGLASAFGARFDMETDAALLLVLSILLWHWGQAGAWILLAGLMRYLFVGAGWLWPTLGRPLSPTWRGKTVAVVLMVTLAVSLVLPIAVARAATGTALALLTWSFAVDVGRLIRQREI